MGYADNREFSDRFLPEIRRIVGPYLLVPAPLKQDQQFATDLLILCARDLRIACRVRRPGYENFWDEFTMRLSYESGVETEHAKFINGFGDWFFYGFAAKNQCSIARWMLLSLRHWRAHLINSPERNKPIRWCDRENGDGCTTFRAYNVRSFPPDPRLVIAEFVPGEDERLF